MFPKRKVPIAHQGGVSYLHLPSRRRDWLPAAWGWRIAVSIGLLVAAVTAGMWWCHG